MFCTEFVLESGDFSGPRGCLIWRLFFDLEVVFLLIDAHFLIIVKVKCGLLAGRLVNSFGPHYPSYFSGVRGGISRCERSISILFLLLSPTISYKC